MRGGGVRPTDAELGERREALLAWYAANHRRLPWRPDPGGLGEPYHVLVSELMLQQTQVATVIDYFHRFLARFPTVADLAAAEEQAVLTAWQGLGYYRRARHLHRAAQAVVERHGGRIPDNLEALRNLPGVGRYTAGAIGSIAFGLPAPVLDGNVKRVFARWFAEAEAIERPAVERAMWEVAERLVAPLGEAGRRKGGYGPGDLNQALMELGATVCTPRTPRCLTCPMLAGCEAGRSGRADQLPVREARKDPRAVVHDVAAIEKRGRWLFEQRGERGLWAGMWQLVTVESDGPEAGGDDADTDAAVREALRRRLTDRLGVELGPLQPIGRVAHQTTHRSITFRVWRTSVRGGRLRPGAGVWRSLSGVTELPLSNAQRKVIALVRESEDAGTAAKR